jgi:hypothetical protein
VLPSMQPAFVIVVRFVFSLDRERHSRKPIHQRVLPGFSDSETRSRQRNTCLGRSGIPEETHKTTY